MKEKGSPEPSPITPAESAQQPAVPSSPAPLTPGMATLLRGSKPLPKSDTKDQAYPSPNSQSPPAPGAPTRSRAVQISLIVADALLLALATRLVLKANGHLGFVEITLCVVALGLGAWLSCLALWR